MRGVDRVGEGGGGVCDGGRGRGEDGEAGGLG